MGLKEEWEDEDAVYDVIGEGEYASIVAKRREEGGQMHHRYILHCMRGDVCDLVLIKDKNIDAPAKCQVRLLHAVLMRS